MVETLKTVWMSLTRRWPLVYTVAALVVAAATYGIRYHEPRALFWDENYHIASAQKYLDGVMYMEPHPPLGKLLLAFGEWLLDPNAGKDKSRFVRVDYIKDADLPPDMSFAGFRLMSVLCMILAAPFFFRTALNVTGNAHLAAAATVPLLFDNGVIVHSRGAMLEGIQLFFLVLALWYFTRIITRGRPVPWWRYGLLGFLVGLVIAVKVNGAVLLLLFPALFGWAWWPALRAGRWREPLAALPGAAAAATGAIGAVLLAVMYVHIALGQTVVPGKTYRASPEYLELIRSGRSASLAAFVVGLRDNWLYMRDYADGVPRLDPCKPGENGSHPLGWPLGNKTINYRWAKDTVDGRTEVRYLYLVPNAAGWFSAFAGVLLGAALLIAALVFGLRPPDGRRFAWVVLFTVLYFAYMAAILQIERVMYLYHYFVPLLFAWLNLAALGAYLFADQTGTGRRHFYANLAAFGLIVLLVYWHFSPLTYYRPLTEGEFALRQWFDFWKMAPVR
ncbi:MAG: hypothetical protein KatS3mg121_0224 [Gammaproteobacteria bacterium]|nr:MAG: hypothetical protein KatS3mg121_0224 [Gammaproteobacteria bacterium]